MYRRSFASLIAFFVLLAAGAAQTEGAARAQTEAEALATDAGVIAGAADACGADDTSMFQYKAEQAIEEVAVDEDDRTNATKAFLSAKRSARAEQKLHAPMPCGDVLRLYRKQPLWKNY